MARRYSQAAFKLWYWLPLYFVVVVVSLAVFVAFASDSAPPQRTVPGDVGFITFAVIVAALGACASLELIKRMTALRGVFHRGALRNWLGAPAEEELHDLLAARPRPRNRRGEPVRSLTDFDIPLEQLAARVSSALATVSSDPAAAPHLAGHLAHVRPDLDYLVPMMDAANHQRDHALRALRDQDIPQDHGEQDVMEMLNEATRRLEWLGGVWREAFPDADQDIQNELDSFQLSAAREWRRAVSTTAIAVAGAVGLSLAIFFQSNVILVTALLAALVGGFLSWVLRDVTAGLERWRQRP